jgi:hypothetical protein
MRVRLLELAPFLERDLPAEEWVRLEGMVGEVFEVQEVDEDGRAWIEKWFDEPDGIRSSHSLALNANEMELV